MKKLNLILLFLFVFSAISCYSSNKKISNKHILIQSINVVFYAYSFETRFPIKCNDIKPKKGKTFKSEDGRFLFKDGSILDTTIRDVKVLHEIGKELKRLHHVSGFPIMDARICCRIKYTNGKIEKLFISGYFTEEIFYKNIRCNSNNHLLFLIKNSIGYYSWMNDNIMNNENELRDSSFKRDSVAGHSGRMF